MTTRVTFNTADRLPGRVRASIAAQRLLAGVRELWAGFSGGADSTALLLVLRQVAPELPLTAVHFHHGLRGAAADADAAWCAGFCRRYDIPFRLEYLAVPDHRRPGESLEMAARRRRLDYWAAQLPAGAAVALGHHADDALEELLLRLGRGANSNGLCGLRARRRLGRVLLVRPLLDLRRTELEAWLRRQGIGEWCTDRTNTDLKMRRNAVRHQLLPLWRELFGGDGGLALSLAALRADTAVLDAAAARRRPRTRAAWAALPPALTARVFRRWLEARTGGCLPPSAPVLHRLRRALAATDARPRRVPLGGGAEVEVTPAGLSFIPGQPGVKRLSVPGLKLRRWRWREHAVLELPEAGLVLRARLMQRSATRVAAAVAAGDGEWFAPAALPEVLTVRGWRPGDRLRPFGGSGSRKLQDLFQDAGVPQPRRGLTPVVLAGRTIVWVPGVRRAEHGRLPSAARAAVGLSCVN
jgi:tRNA(Ile)-lysidine synthase